MKRIRRSDLTCRALFLLLISPCPNVVLAQDSVAKPPAAVSKSTAAPAPQKPTLPSLDNVKVLSVERPDGKKDGDHPGAVDAGIGNIIILNVRGLKNLTDVATCKSATGQPVEPCTAAAIALFLDGREVKGLKPESGAPQLDSGKVRFHLERGPDSDEVWADLLGEPRFNSTFFHRPTEVSVGLADSYALPTNVQQGPGGLTPFHLIRIHKVRFFLASGLFLVFLGLCYSLAATTNLLRASGAPLPPPTLRTATAISDPQAAVLRPTRSALRKWKQRRNLNPYSLGRWQMAVWFVLVIGAFGYIWIVTGASDTITSTVLILLGIGASTALGAAAIDSTQMSSASDKLAAVLNDRATFAARRVAVERDPRPQQDVNKVSELATLKTLLDKADADMEILKGAMKPTISNGWWDDMIRDENGSHSFHRFQIFVWTIVLVFLFVYSVWSRLSMPEFGATLLAVMGISGGTYLGFKIPEKQT